MPDDRLLDYPDSVRSTARSQQQEIHSTALVHGGSQIGAGVRVGPYSIVGPDVRLGKGVTLGGHVVIGGRTSIGAGTSIFPFSSVGSTSQVRAVDQAGELEIGTGVTIREYCNVSAGSAADSRTVVSDDVFLMAYSHVGHDCRIGREATIANGANLGGHVEIGNKAFVGGMVGVHQFCHVGAYAMISGGAMILQDIPPFCLASGQPARVLGLNSIGLNRAGFEAARVREIRRMFRILFPRRASLKLVIRKILSEIRPSSDREILVQFVQRSKRGISRL